MKQHVKALAIGLALFTLAGCGDKLQITATPVKGVESIQYHQSQLDVYCETGICQFDLLANEDTDLKINMHYSQAKPFEKIEGVSVTGKMGSSVKMLSGNAFQVSLEANAPAATLQIVDYYRN
ncbi:spore gernimation protein [Photobacterium japonica]|uniref:spore gernimation protein n=1 Tax=Photobacterium japonica TaxID=2910235 RepID=UPI003D12ED50